MLNKTRSRGRPRGRSTAREDILEVARRRFSQEGYAAVSVRSIAHEAGVDPALVNYHFGSKRGLFGAALELSINPAVIVAQVVDAPLAVLPERILRTLLAVWDEPHQRAPLVALLRQAVTDPEASRLFREVLEREIVGRIAERVGGPDASRRATGVATQLAGLIFLRHVLRIEPIASMTPDEVVAATLPGVRAALRPNARPLDHGACAGRR